MGEQHIEQEYPLSEVTSRVIVAAVEAHRRLRPGFGEVIYRRALEIELPVRNPAFGREVRIDVCCKAQQIEHKRIDFVIDEVLVEITARAKLEEVGPRVVTDTVRELGNCACGLI